MKGAQTALICGVILSYLLPWHVYIIEWETNRDGPHPGLMVIPIRCTYPSGFQVSADLAVIAHRQWYIEGGLRDGAVIHKTYPVRGRAVVTALYVVILLLPLLIAAFSLVRVIRSPKTGRTVGPWIAAALVIFAFAAFLCSGNGPRDVYEFSISPILYHQGTHEPVLPVRPTLWGPLSCLLLSVALAGLWLAESIRRRRDPKRVILHVPPADGLKHVALNGRTANVAAKRRITL
ncbi:MAG TPA: hypothetical protein VMZ92_18565 [Planctomycetota bacterium]|nr:hypothetical protein [Planctomycetota bacterium]